MKTLQIKSTAFDVKRTGSGFRFAGRGSGHGVGLCVMGSVRLAARGQTADAILARYFPGLTISRINAASIVVSLPERDGDQRPVIQDLALRARDALVKQLGVHAPPQLTLRFYPTVESYQRATGKPWFTSGAAKAVSRAWAHAPD